MGAPKLSEDLRPLSDMKTRPAEVVGQAQQTGRPVFLTRYGKGVAVVLSLESYEELQAASAKMRLVSALREAERAVAEGETVDNADMDELLRSWGADAT